LRSSFISAFFWPPPRPWPNMPTMENIIIIGNSSVMGLRPAPPGMLNISAIMPSIATTMMTGINFIRMLPGMTRGTSGGGSR